MEEFKILRKQGWELNPNDKIVNSILKALERNGGHCPSHTSSDREHNICPCSSYLKNDICHCGLYIKIDKKLN